MKWTTQSWKKFNSPYIPKFPDAEALEAVCTQLSALPPLVFAGEVLRLRERLALAENGKAFVLQGGDCAERFIDCHEEALLSKFKILLQMSVVLTYSLRKPVIKIGRLAGQYGKPRSKQTEDGPDGTIPSYFGDNINSFLANPISRVPDPKRLLDGYFYATATLNYIRALLDGGFADLHSPSTWNLDALKPSPRAAEYRTLTNRIADAINFMESLDSSRNKELSSTEFWTSHEGLILPYEAALTRKYAGNSCFASSAHFLWIGERTRNLDGPHLEYFRGIENPVGIKIGPNSNPEDIIKLVQVLNPDNHLGKIVFILRMGAEKIHKALPPLVRSIQKEGLRGLWMSDPMHGNTQSTTSGIKTRDFTTIENELSSAAAILKDENAMLGGVHLELSGDDVTECTGGPEALREDDLSRRYETWCDPRLNYAQALEIAFLLSECLEK